MLQVRKATGLTLKLNGYGLPVIECTRWTKPQPLEQALTLEQPPVENRAAHEGKGIVESKDTTTVTDNKNKDNTDNNIEVEIHEVDTDSVAITNNKDGNDTISSNTTANTVSATEERLTQVSLEADRYSRSCIQFTPLNVFAFYFSHNFMRIFCCFLADLPPLIWVLCCCH